MRLLGHNEDVVERGAVLVFGGKEEIGLVGLNLVGAVEVERDVAAGVG